MAASCASFLRYLYSMKHLALILFVSAYATSYAQQRTGLSIATGADQIDQYLPYLKDKFTFMRLNGKLRETNFVQFFFFAPKEVP